MLDIKSNLPTFRTLLSNSKNVLITTHFQPDGDAIGSSVALATFLKKRGHEVTIIVPSTFNQNLKFLEEGVEVINFQNKPDAAIKYSDAADLIFCLDYNHLSRVHDYAHVIARTSAPRVLIDHHPEPDEEMAAFHLWNQSVASTAELIFELIQLLDAEQEIDPLIARAIYTGILTDTGMFQFPATTAQTHKIAAKLIEIGVDINQIYNRIYNTYHENRLRLLGYCISEKLVVLPELKAAYISLNADEVKRFNIKSGDTEGIVNYPLKIDGIIFSTLLVDRDEKRKLSFRSIGGFDVNQFARMHFDGGGHKNAAGGQSKLSFDETVQKFIRTLEQSKDILITSKTE